MDVGVGGGLVASGAERVGFKKGSGSTCLGERKGVGQL